MYRIAGIAAVALAALIFSREFSAYQKRRMGETEGFLSLLTFMRGEINCHLRPVSEWCRDFRDPALERVGFLPALRESCDLSGAYSACERQLSVTDAERKLLSAFTSSFGHGYREDELKLVDYYCAEMGRAAARCRRDVPRYNRLVRTLCASAAVAAVILLL